MSRHAKRFTGVPRQLLDRERVYLLGWVGNRWEVIAESQPLVDTDPSGAPEAPASGASREEAFGVAWSPVTPEELRERRTVGPAGDWLA
jgi:hypothetical protein